nr:superinfection immunity protein [Candidatus Enterousia merdequi]
MLLDLIVILFLTFIYFIPTFVACSRHHINALAIFILNLFLGCTIVGWVIALIWAVYKQEPEKNVRKRK